MSAFQNIDLLSLHLLVLDRCAPCLLHKLRYLIDNNKINLFEFNISILHLNIGGIILYFILPLNRKNNILIVIIINSGSRGPGSSSSINILFFNIKYYYKYYEFTFSPNKWNCIFLKSKKE